MPNFGPNETFPKIANTVKFSYQIFSNVKQKIRKFLWFNFEKNSKNLIFGTKPPILGPKMPHFGPNEIFQKIGNTVKFSY